VSDFATALKQATDRCWQVHLTIDGPDDFVVSALRGDCNCPHKKPYSKSDGHGFESISTEDDDDVCLDSLDKVIEWMLALPELKR
jgi:hypothetical protein